MATLLIGLGSNDSPELHIRQALEALKAKFGQVKASRQVWTAPLSGKGANYLNAVASVQSRLQAQEARQLLKSIEKSLGRNRSTPGIVSIDLDILAYGGLVIPELDIPSPDLLERDFCLLPAAEIEGGFVHPLEGMTLDVLARRLFPCECKSVPALSREGQ